MWIWAWAVAGVPAGVTLANAEKERQPLGPIQVSARPDARVVGGEVADRDAYPDAVAVLLATGVCTGTLIHPEYVITAAHCTDDILAVIVDTNDWNVEQGEVHQVTEVFVHPLYDGDFQEPGALDPGVDIAILRLQEPSAVPPRPIAMGCAVSELEVGSNVTLVGFGNTTEDGMGMQSLKNIGHTQIVSAECGPTYSTDFIGESTSGCSEEARPNGELIAGGRLDLDGDGEQDPAVSSCFGDSGGPLYLDTPYGEMLVGVASRVVLPGILAPNLNICGEGGIWVRPDRFRTFIQNQTGIEFEEPTCNLPPTVSSDPVELRAGGELRVSLTIDDADSTEFMLEVLDVGTLQRVEVDGQELVLEGGDVGATQVRVRVVDLRSDHPGSLPVEVEHVLEVEVLPNGCGCRTGTPWMGWLLGLGLLVARRRG